MGEASGSGGKVSCSLNGLDVHCTDGQVQNWCFVIGRIPLFANL